MTPQISVVLIAFNSYQQVYLTLESLKRQSLDFEKFEVILVDDCSTDQTYSFQSYVAPFSFRYIRNDENCGRAKSKNIGLSSATGSAIIFLDGDILVDPNFINFHLEHHAQGGNILVTGTQSQYSIYTVFDPKFDENQLKELLNSNKRSDILTRRLNFRDSNGKENLIKLQRLTTQLISPAPIVIDKDLDNSIYNTIYVPNPSFLPKDIILKYGHTLDGFHLKYMFCITRNVSMPTNLLKEAGGFDENFIGWGYEDWEAGWRLIKKGVKVVEDERIRTFHQEHAYSSKDRSIDIVRNYSYFMRKHPCIEVSVFVLFLLNKKNLLELNQIVDQYKELSEKYPNDFLSFRRAYMDYLLYTMSFIERNIPLSAIQESIIDKNEVEKEFSQLKELPRFNELVDTFNLFLQL